jgi:hypothetical protein
MVRMANMRLDFIQKRPSYSGLPVLKSHRRTVDDSIDEKIQ